MELKNSRFLPVDSEYAYMATQSKGFKPDMFSSNWHVFFGITNVISLDFSRTASSIIDSRCSAEHTLGKHNPKDTPGPMSILFQKNDFKHIQRVASDNSFRILTLVLLCSIQFGHEISVVQYSIVFHMHFRSEQHGNIVKMIRNQRSFPR